MTTYQRAWTPVVLTVSCLCVSASLFAQTVKVGGKDVQIHGSVQQGVAASDYNNYLTLETSRGSAAMTDFALNATSNLAPKLRVGAQLYVSNLGHLENYQPQIDWAFADYRFANAFGVRGGKMKTVLGLFNDTQDMEFLYTWALLPQSIYPLDFRVATIAHLGADAYGAVQLGKAGSLDYVVYTGTVKDDPEGGHHYGFESVGITGVSIHDSRTAGFDTRWTAPVEGLMVGFSFSASSVVADGIYAAYNIPITADTNPWHRHAVYADYQRSGLRVSAEWLRDLRDSTSTPDLGLPGTHMLSHSWFAAASYRVFRMLEVGSYYSSYVADTSLPASRPDNHIYDKAVSGRVDLNRFWHVKVEGHFMDGYGPAFPLPHGFYLRDNPTGLNPTTNLLVVRTGFNF